MITIKIKTPRDYWKQLQEWVRMPRQEQCIDMVDYQIAVFENMFRVQAFDYLSEKDRKRVIEDVAEMLYKSKEQTYKLIKAVYPKFNIPK